MASNVGAPSKLADRKSEIQSKREAFASGGRLVMNMHEIYCPALYKGGA